MFQVLCWDSVRCSCTLPSPAFRRSFSWELRCAPQLACRRLQGTHESAPIGGAAAASVTRGCCTPTSKSKCITHESSTALPSRSTGSCRRTPCHWRRCGTWTRPSCAVPHVSRGIRRAVLSRNEDRSDGHCSDGSQLGRTVVPPFQGQDSSRAPGHGQVQQRRDGDPQRQRVGHRRHGCQANLAFFGGIIVKCHSCRGHSGLNYVILT